ncbi:MAG TPA: hypothetical protein VFF28_04725 [Candidatus Nanoarchaeia archaeon]|nr:hypothetical protein [Candidatus Nanoarchaeia archaeon]
MDGSCVLEPLRVEKPLETRLAETRQEQGSVRDLLAELWQVARQYVREIGLKDTSLEYRTETGAIVLRDAPFVGTVPICAITANQIVPYF